MNILNKKIFFKVVLGTIFSVSTGVAMDDANENTGLLPSYHNEPTSSSDSDGINNTRKVYENFIDNYTRRNDYEKNALGGKGLTLAQYCKENGTRKYIKKNTVIVPELKKHHPEIDLNFVDETKSISYTPKKDDSNSNCVIS